MTIKTTTRGTIEAFFERSPVAVLDGSRDGRKFGNVVYQHLKVNEFAYAVHPEVEEIDCESCYPNLENIPERVEAAALVIPSAQAEIVVKGCLAYGIRHVWLQLGAEAAKTVRYCEKYGFQPNTGSAS